MRRPSWNKSQAIQQVVSLKALFDPPDDDSGAGIFRKIIVSQPIETSNEFEASHLIPYPDSPRSAEFSGGFGQFVADKDSYNNTVSLRFFFYIFFYNTLSI